jgi:hypothetical protein
LTKSFTNEGVTPTALTPEDLPSLVAHLLEPPI